MTFTPRGTRATARACRPRGPPPVLASARSPAATQSLAGALPRPGVLFAAHDAAADIARRELVQPLPQHVVDPYDRGSHPALLEPEIGTSSHRLALTLRDPRQPGCDDIDDGAYRGREQRCLVQVAQAFRIEAGAAALRMLIASNGPIAVRVTKSLIYDTQGLSRVDMPSARAKAAHVFASDDAREGLETWVARRPPSFTGH